MEMSLSNQRAEKRLLAGLARVTGLSEDTDFRAEFAAATRPHGRHFSEHCTGVSNEHCYHRSDDTDYVRQSIPEPYALPIPLRNEGDSPGSIRCPCGSLIMHAHVIYKKDNPGVNLIVGSCCICRFLSVGRHCRRCYAEHKNRLDNLCNACRDLPREILDMSDNEYAEHKANLATHEANMAASRAERIARLAELKRLGICLTCARARIRPPYTECFKCKFPNECASCKSPCPERFDRCFKCAKGNKAA